MFTIKTHANAIEFATSVRTLGIDLVKTLEVSHYEFDSVSDILDLLEGDIQKLREYVNMKLTENEK